MCKSLSLSLFLCVCVCVTLTRTRDAAVHELVPFTIFKANHVTESERPAYGANGTTHVAREGAAM